MLIKVDMSFLNLPGLLWSQARNSGLIVFSQWAYTEIRFIQRWLNLRCSLFQLFSSFLENSWNASPQTQFLAGPFSLSLNNSTIQHQWRKQVSILSGLTKQKHTAAFCSKTSDYWQKNSESKKITINEPMKTSVVCRLAHCDKRWTFTFCTAASVHNALRFWHWAEIIKNGSEMASWRNFASWWKQLLPQCEKATTFDPECVLSKNLA